MDVTSILLWVQTAATVVFVPLAGFAVHWVRKTNETLVDLRLEVVALQLQVQERRASFEECRARDHQAHDRLFGRLDKHGQAIAGLAAGVGGPIPDLG